MSTDGWEGRRKGRPKRRWMDSVDVYLSEKGEETQNTAAWRQLVRNVDPTEKWEKMRKEKLPDGDVGIQNN